MYRISSNKCEFCLASFIFSLWHIFYSKVFSFNEELKELLNLNLADIEILLSGLTQ